MQMLLQFLEPHLAMNRRTIVQDVKVAFLKIDDLPALGIFDPSVSDIPFFRDGPVEDLRICSHFFAGHRPITAQIPQALPQAVPRDAAANRVKVCNNPKELNAFLYSIPVAQYLAN